MAKAKATKREILSFIKGRKIVTSYDLMERFSYTYSYACKKLSLLKRQSLVKDLGNTSSSHRGQRCVTRQGYNRLVYLQSKTEDNETKRNKAESEAKQREEELKRLRNRLEELETHPWIIYEELAPISEELCSIFRAIANIETTKLPLELVPYVTKFRRLLVEAERIINRLPIEEGNQVKAFLFKPTELKRFFLRRL